MGTTTADGTAPLPTAEQHGRPWPPDAPPAQPGKHPTDHHRWRVALPAAVPAAGRRAPTGSPLGTPPPPATGGTEVLASIMMTRSLESATTLGHSYVEFCDAQYW